MSAPPEGPIPGVRVIPLTRVPEVRADDDLGQVLTAALAHQGLPLLDGDVLVVSAKIVSKARGLVIPPEAKEEAIRTASARLVARRRHGTVTTSVVETVAGPVLAGAGIDASNAPDGLLLLPEDPDAEASMLRTALEEALGVRIGVVLSDTSSRVWRIGVADLALGSSGVAALQDLRGRPDGSGRPLGITVRALGDELAAAADLVKGKSAQVPAAIIRGVPDAVLPPPGHPRSGAPTGDTASGNTAPADTANGDVAPGDTATAHTPPGDTAAGEPGARQLNRTDGSDWFRRPSLESVWQALGIPAAEEPVAAMEPEEDRVRIDRALTVAQTNAPTGPGGPAALEVEDSPTGPAVRIRPIGPTPGDLAAAGALAERVRTALRAEEIAAPLPHLSIDLVLNPPRTADTLDSPQETRR
ncbi:MAG: coenzyme F420-0:L-glutamate ligase [Brachybacterium sp.]|nr:coenzyme F420-0:L-glutamate ligase [Brachybacterium sp.]